jgi:hypothetical protein
MPYPRKRALRNLRSRCSPVGSFGVILAGNDTKIAILRGSSVIDWLSIEAA